MRKVDPSIKVLTSYPSPNTVRIAGSEIDYLSPHQYSVGDLNGTEDESSGCRKRSSRMGMAKTSGSRSPNGTLPGGDWGLTRGMLQTMGNALVCSRYQQMMHRYSDLIEIANLSNFRPVSPEASSRPDRDGFTRFPAIMPRASISGRPALSR